MNYLYKNTFETQMGSMTSLVADEGVFLLQFTDSLNHQKLEGMAQKFNRQIIEKEHSINIKLQEELVEYLAGKRKDFTVPTIMKGTTFQTKVWHVLKDIPYGTTLDYQSIGNKIGYPKANRAIGNANGSNAIMILIPCHRVIRSDGSIGGYAGGVARKNFLIKLEGK